MIRPVRLLDTENGRVGVVHSRHLATLKRQKQAVARNSRIRVSSSAKREYFRELKSEQSQYDNVERGVVLFIMC